MMAGKSSLVLKQVGRIISPRCSTPKIQLSSARSSHFSASPLASPSGFLNKSCLLTPVPVTPRNQRKRCRKLTFSDGYDIVNHASTPKLKIDECADTLNDVSVFSEKCYDFLNEALVDTDCLNSTSKLVIDEYPNVSNEDSAFRDDCSNFLNKELADISTSNSVNDKSHSKSLLCVDTPRRDEVVTNGLPLDIEWCLLGRGSFGTVIKSTYKGETVAVKVISSKKEQSSKCMCNEENAVEFGHDNITKVLKVVHPESREPGYGLVIMEYNENNVSLQEYVGCRAVFISDDLRNSFTKQIAEALRYMHDRGIIHLDLKPANVLVVDNSCCKLCDFGSSRKVLALNSKHFEPTEFLQGSTLAYIAPEILQGEIPTHKSDIYSLGILMWQLMNQLEPYELNYEGQSCPESIIYEVVKNKRRPQSHITKRRHNYNEKYYKKIYESCWDHSPANRPTACDVAKFFHK